MEQIEYDNDDKPVGRVLSRREMISLLAGMGGAALLAACNPFQTETGQPTAPANQTAQSTGAATGTPMSAEGATVAAATPVEASPTADVAAVPDCVVRPELAEGPYFVDEKLNRSDIRSDPATRAVKQGVPLALGFVVSQVGNGNCSPISGAQVDVWHCDAEGLYSDVVDRGLGVTTVGQQFLRGYQVTGADGKAEFMTIYPGWYPGRTPHIHFKIRTSSATGLNYDFTSQLFFDDAISEQVYAQEPYAGKGRHTTRNDNDGGYRASGDQLTLSLVKNNDGYAATFHVGLDI